MKSVCKKGPVVQGVDVSKWQGRFDWIQQKMNHVAFGFAKATDVSKGVAFVDPQFHNNWFQLKAGGFVRGAYHFLHPSVDAKVQADYYVKMLGPIEKDDILMLDWESTDGVPAHTDVEHALTWLAEVERLTGKIPVLYTYPYFASALPLDDRFKRYPLFISHMGVVCPLVPAPWDNWVFWQYSNSHNKLDLDVFNGTLDELKAFALSKP